MTRLKALLNLLAMMLLTVFGVMPSDAQAQNAPENLKGTGEVVINTAGGVFEAALKKAFFDPFTRDTGIKVVTTNSGPAKLLSSVKLGQPAADMSGLAGSDLASWIEKDALEPVEYRFFSKETLAGLPDSMKNKYGVGNFLYSIVVAYNTKKYPETGKHPNNWGDFFNIEAFPGKRSLPNCGLMIYGGLLEATLLGDGVPTDKLYPIDIDRAFSKLKQFKPQVGRWWNTGAEAPQSLIDGEVDVAAVWNGRIATARSEGAPLALSWDQSLLQHDYWTVMKSAPNKENAFKLMAYMARPEAQAAFAEAIPYGPTNRDAFKLISKERAEMLPGAPGTIGKQVLQDYAYWSAKRSDGRTNLEVATERCLTLLAQ